MDLKDFQKKFREGFSGNKEQPKKKYEDMSPEEKEKHLREKNKSQSFSGFAEGGIPELDLIERFQAAQQLPVTQQDKTDAELAQINEEAKSPYQQTKPELMQDKVQQEAAKTPVGQAVQESVPVSDFQKFMNSYDEKYNKSTDEIKAAREQDSKKALLANVSKALGSLGAAQIQRQAGVNAGLKDFTPVKGPNTAGQLENDRKALMDKLVQDYKLMQSGKPKGTSELDKAKAQTEKAKAGYYEARSKAPSQKVTEGEKVIDREFAKDYNDWSSGGKADYEVNSKIFKDAIKGLKSGKVSTGSMSGMGSRIPGYRSDTREVEDQVRKAINGMLRATLGAQFTEKEGERIFAQTFDPFKSEEANVAAMEAELAKLEKRKNSIEDMGKYYTKNKTLSGYEVPAANSEMREVKRKTKDGRTAIFNADTKEFIRYE